MCRAKNGELLTNTNQLLARWIEHFEEHLNEGFESKQPTRPVNSRDDGVDFDLPSREEIEGDTTEMLDRGCNVFSVQEGR
jgi:hypothetical protein